jgi:hypothetical protein
LILGGMCPPCPMIVDDTQQFRLERAVPDVSISPEPLAMVALPVRKLGTRRR